ncbi:hypothetical protein CEXT_573781 [Caerostris extrusa]|uniref:Uncharacterized protein n=1 Tax=Caerostris extrusa TaxID=172846 RepID=A0AAV4RRX2_CAEEX|nr:hypothetical protein CEXT_573781 [Caerostris extrusa]
MPQDAECALVYLDMSKFSNIPPTATTFPQLHSRNKTSEEILLKAICPPFPVVVCSEMSNLNKHLSIPNATRG